VHCHGGLCCQLNSGGSVGIHPLAFSADPPRAPALTA
jgi:hypothetical protein